MKCPNCRSEVGNQAVCPYCGTTAVHHSAQNLKGLEYTRSSGQSVQERPQKRRGLELRDVDRRIRNLETKVNLCLVLLCGNFALMILAILVLALRP